MKTEVSFNQPEYLAQSVLSVPKSATLAINELSKQMILEGKDVIRLGLGQSPFPVPEIMVNALKTYATAKDYMAVQGYLPLREAIAGFVKQTEDLSADADDIIIGPGSKELLFGLQMALDCELVLPAPSWVSYDPQGRLLGKTVHWLPCYAEHGWKLTAQNLERHCQQHGSRRQLLILNSPNNPSGACFTEQELKSLADVASRYNIIVLSDEIYSELHYRGNHQSIARYYPDGTIISNGISKWAGAGGWRLGYFVFPKNLRAILASMTVIASETFTSVSAPIQMAAISAFEGSSEMHEYVLASRNIMSSIGQTFSRLLIEQGIEVEKPDGGFYLLPDFSSYREKLFSKGITHAAEFCKQMLQETGVAGLPASDFGIKQGFLMRFAFVDFDGGQLIHRVLENPSTVIDDKTPELKHLFSAAQRIGHWINGL